MTENTCQAPTSSMVFIYCMKKTNVHLILCSNVFAVLEKTAIVPADGKVVSQFIDQVCLNNFFLAKCQKRTPGLSSVLKARSVTPKAVNLFKTKICNGRSLNSFIHLHIDEHQIGDRAHPTLHTSKSVAHENKLCLQDGLMSCPLVFRVRRHVLKFTIQKSTDMLREWKFLQTFFNSNFILDGDVDIGGVLKP